MDIRYVAGIIDGEGTISLSKQMAGDKFRRPHVSVPSTTIEIVDAFKKQFGGHITRKKRYNEKHSESWVWVIRDKAAIKFLAKVQKHLIVPEKQFRAGLIVKGYKKVTPRNGKYSYDQMQEKMLFEYLFLKTSKKVAVGKIETFGMGE